MLTINDLDTGYGKKQILFGVSLEVKQGEIVSIIGPNGSGKSTLLKAITGLIPTWKGELLFNDENINNSNPAKNLTRGLCFSPQGRPVFGQLTVKENLEIGGHLLSKAESKTRIEEVVQLFPILKELLKQRARLLSGGEQQILAISRILICRPKLMMLDEPSLGLSPKLIHELFETLKKVSKQFDIGMLIIEQKVRAILDLCDKVNCLKLGKVAFTGIPAELQNNPRLLQSLFL